MGTLKFNTWQNPNGTENYKCRAWVNFNGIGTVAIRASGNVSSITDRGTGAYTVNFSTNMPDVNYAVSFATSYLAWITGANDVLVDSVKIDTASTAGSPTDVNYIGVSIHR